MEGSKSTLMAALPTLSIILASAGTCTHGHTHTHFKKVLKAETAESLEFKATWSTEDSQGNLERLCLQKQTNKKKVLKWFHWYLRIFF